MRHGPNPVLVDAKDKKDTKLQPPCLTKAKWHTDSNKHGSLRRSVFLLRMVSCGHLKGGQKLKLYSNQKLWELWKTKGIMHFKSCPTFQIFLLFLLNPPTTLPALFTSLTSAEITETTASTIKEHYPTAFQDITIVKKCT